MSKQKSRTSVLVSSKRFYIAVLALGVFLIAILYYVYFFRIDIPLAYNALKLEYGKSVDIKKHTLLATKDPVIIDSIHVDTSPLQYKKVTPTQKLASISSRFNTLKKARFRPSCWLSP